MSKPVLAAIAGVVVVAAGIVGFVLTRPDDTQSSQTNTANSSQTEATKADASASQSGTLAEFLAAGENKKCTYSDADSSGTMYFSKQRLRADLSRTQDGTTQQSSMIVQEGTQYVWFADKQQGVKFAFSASDSGESQTASSQGGLSADTKYDFSCESWTVDEAMFTPPANVTFTDLSNIQVPSVPTP